MSGETLRTETSLTRNESFAPARAEVIVVYADDFTIEYINPFALGYWTGKTEQDFISKPLSEAIPGLGTAEHLKTLQTVYQSGIPSIRKEVKFTLDRNGDGLPEDTWFDAYYLPLLPLEDTRGRIAMFLTEVSPKKPVLSGPNGEESQASLITNALPVLISYVDKDQCYRFNNMAYEKWFGHKREDIYGKHLSKVLGENAYKGLRPHVEKALNGTPVHFEMRIPYKDGGERYIAADYIPHASPDGEIQGYYAVINDITDNKAFSERLEQLVAERTNELMESNLRLMKSNQDLEQFTYIASHDLQEPLRKIRTFASLLSASATDPVRQRSLAEKIDLSAQRMARLINDLLDFGRVRSSERFIDVDLEEVVNGAISDLDLVIQQKKAVIHREALPTISAIPHQMSQLFNNLLGNALKFSVPERRPEITIRCAPLHPDEAISAGLREGRRYYRISIRDNGIGFKEEFAKQIFMIFQRLHSHETYGGSGIGLALCKKIVEETHNGLIFASGKENNGSEFTIILPEQQHRH